MFCGECGTQNPDTNGFCKNCGKALKKGQTTPSSVPAAVPAQHPFQPSGAPADITIAAGTASSVERKSSRNWIGILSLIPAILSWLVYPYVMGVLAIILGAYSVFQTRKRSGKIAYLALAGIIIALVAVLFNYFYLDLFAKSLFPATG
jgi:hypothetical protein